MIFSWSCENWWAETEKKIFPKPLGSKNWHRDELKEVGTACSAVIQSKPEQLLCPIAVPWAAVLRVWGCPWPLGLHRTHIFLIFPIGLLSIVLQLSLLLFSQIFLHLQSTRDVLYGSIAFQRVACGTAGHIFTLVFLQNEDSKEGRREQGEVKGR